MEKLLSAERVQDIVRSSVNLDYLVPQLMKHGLLTPVEFSQLSDKSVDEEQRINDLIGVLKWKGELNDQVKRFTASLEGAPEHSGHEDILSIVNEEVTLLSSTEVVNGAQNAVTLSFERKRQWPMQDDCESDSSHSTKRLKTQHILPNMIPNFIGREDQLQHSIELLQEDSTHILSVVGMPAVGKSQFAIAVGQHMQQQLKYNVIYHDLLNTTKFSDEFLDVNGCEHQCLILDNIDNLLFNTQLTSAMLSSLQHVMSHCRIKIITTSCKVFRHPELTIKTIRMLPFNEIESKMYLLEGYSAQDVMPVVKACAGVPLALRCAIENITNHQWDIQDFCDDEKIMQLLEVESFGSNSLSQVKARLKIRFSVLISNHQDNLKKIANNSENLHDLSSADRRSLYNSGWLEKGEDGNFILNGLLCALLREISDHVVKHETGHATLTP